MGKEKTPFCCHKIFVLNGLSTPCQGLYTFEKADIKKKGKKSDFKEILFKLATNGQSDKEFLLT